MPLETRTAAINLTPPQDGSLTDDVYRYLIDNFALIRRNMLLLEALIVQLQVSAQGAMAQVTSAPPYPDITATYQTITFYDVITMATRGCTLNTTTGEFTFDIEGKWLLLFSLSTLINSSGASRNTNIRLFNVTDTVAGSTTQIEVSSQADSISTTVFLPVTIAASDKGKTFRSEIGGGSTFTGVEWNTVTLGLFYQDQLGSLIDPTP